MTLSILKTWVPSPSEWDDAWQNCHYSTYFQSREWAEIWTDYSHGMLIPAPLMVVFSDGTKTLLPFSKEKIFKGFVTRYISSPAGTFGGWLSDSSLDQQYQKLLLKLIAQSYGNLIWRFNPYERVEYPGGLGVLTKGETHALDLSIGFDKIYRSWTKGHASAVRQARKAGVEIILAETREDWENYFHVYEDSLKRWGKNATLTYTQNFFELLFLRASPNVKLWLAKFEGGVIAGALCFYSPTHVVYWHGAALSSHFELRPVHLLMYESIKDAADRGFKWFDFNPSGDLDGVKAFKRSFGASSIESNSLSLISTKQKLIRFIRTSFDWSKKGA